MKTWLITGGTGFLGRHVMAQVAEYAAPGDRVVATGRSELDLCNPEQTERFLAELRPDITLHLAGLTPPAPPTDLYRANVLGTLHLLEGLKRLGRPTRVILAGSAAELGPVDPDHLPTDESYPPRPTTPYGLSKHLATQAGLCVRSPVDVIATRLYNITGPGAPIGQAFGRFAAEFAREPRDRPITLNTGTLDSKRDFIDVRDAAGALLRLALSGLPGRVYHVGTGESNGVGLGLMRLIQVSSRRVSVNAEPTTHPDDSRADSTRLRQDTGWAPRYSFDQTIEDLWRSVVCD